MSTVQHCTDDRIGLCSTLRNTAQTGHCWRVLGLRPKSQEVRWRGFKGQAFSGASWRPGSRCSCPGRRCRYGRGRPSGGFPARRAGSSRAASGGCNRRSSRHCRRSGGALVAVVPAVLDPLPHVAVHVVEAPGVRRVGADLGGPVPVIVRFFGRDLVAPRVARRRPSPGDILPLGLGK
jgi:hypothetical protein